MSLDPRLLNCRYIENRSGESDRGRCLKRKSRTAGLGGSNRRGLSISSPRFRLLYVFPASAPIRNNTDKIYAAAEQEARRS